MNSKYVSGQMEAIVLIIIQMIFTTRAVLKAGERDLEIPQF